MPAFDPEETLAASLADDRFAAKPVVRRPLVSLLNRLPYRKPDGNSPGNTAQR